MSEAEIEEFDEIDELLIAEGVVTEEEIREAKEWTKDVDVDELIDSAEPIDGEEDLDKIDEDIENTPRIDEVEADEVVPPEKQDNDGTKPYDPTDEFGDE